MRAPPDARRPRSTGRSSSDSGSSSLPRPLGVRLPGRPGDDRVELLVELVGDAARHVEELDARRVTTVSASPVLWALATERLDSSSDASRRAWSLWSSMTSASWIAIAMSSADRLRRGHLVGRDRATFAGLADLHEPDHLVIDEPGARSLWPSRSSAGAGRDLGSAEARIVGRGDEDGDLRVVIASRRDRSRSVIGPLAEVLGCHSPSQMLATQTRPPSSSIRYRSQSGTSSRRHSVKPAAAQSCAGSRPAGQLGDDVLRRPGLELLRRRPSRLPVAVERLDEAPARSRGRIACRRSGAVP